MDHPIWEASSPPPEDWQTEDVDREWQHNGIVSEEVDAFGIKHYEVKWADWHRPDNTNTTWDQGLNDMDAELEAWNDMQTEKRVREAKNSLSIKIPLDLGQLWHEDATVELSRGYEEKRRESARTGLQRYANWDNVPKLTDNDSESSEDQHDERRSSDDSDTASSTGHARISHNRTRLIRSSTIGTQAFNKEEDLQTTDRSIGSQWQQSRLNTSQSRPLPRRKPSSRQVVSESSSPDTSPSEDNTQPRRPIKPLPRRRQMVRSAIVESPEASPAPLSRPSSLKDAWNLVARGAGAAPISFVNEVNSEPYPLGLNGFEYCECHYICAQGVQRPELTSEYIVSCDCVSRCEDATSCHCQGPSELLNDFGEREFAYTHEGLFKFNVSGGVEVIECNKNCSCTVCSNRVAQRPRDVPIEIFRTENCGWGVRATVDLARGKVLGIFTGELITREDAHRRTGDRKAYVFDLDVHETGSDDEDDGRRYSVDSYRAGNWSRFINHSCEPNLQIFPVIWDTIPELNQPYLAFVATGAILARSELTIDYEPGAALEFKRSKGKGKARVPDGAKPCMCGAESCRGWVRV